jgi:hypothetical protein
MHYHSVLVNLYQPFVAEGSTDQSDSPQRIATEASEHFETLIRLYFLRHGFENIDLFLCHPLSIFGFIMLERIKADPDSTDLAFIRSTLVLAAKGLHDQGQSYYLARMTLHLLKEAMRPEELEMLHQIAEFRDVVDDVARLKMHEVQSRWPPTLLRITDDPEAQRLNDLAKQYMNMSIESSDDDRGPGDLPVAM